MKTPQRKPNKHMSGFELLTKSLTGTHKVKTPNEKKAEEINKILRK